MSYSRPIVILSDNMDLAPGLLRLPSEDGAIVVLHYKLRNRLEVQEVGNVMN